MADSVSSVVLQGSDASPGVVVGRAIILDRRRTNTPHAHIEATEIDHEIDRLQKAVQKSLKQIRNLRTRVESTHGGEHIQILEAHELMLQDDMLVQQAIEHIAEKNINAEWALQKALESLKEFFNELDSEYFKERRSDVEFVGDHILRNLAEQESSSLMDLIDQARGDSILVSHSLSPAEAIQLHGTTIVGFCTVAGTKTAHTSIVARSLEIPSVVGVVGLHESIGAGDTLLLDGKSGEIIVHPTKKQIDTRKRRNRRLQKITDRLRADGLGVESKTTDGFQVQLSSNLDLIEELPSINSHGAHGVGLFRTEYLYLNRQTLPTEDEQFEAYSQVLKSNPSAPVTIRTLDIGGDKLDVPSAVRNQLKPFFGLRAIRYCLREKKIFRTQLTALMRASVHGRLRILIPFITDVTEIRQVKAIIQEIRSELASRHVPFADDVELGAMIEIPSAACIADLLVREVDFVSVGTNDLIQYTLAISRESTDIQYLYHPLHPAVLRMLRWISDAAHNEGIRLTMCGEMAAQPMYSVVLLGFRFNELSMSPPAVPIVREIIKRSDLRSARDLVNGLFQFSTYGEVERHVQTYMLYHFRDLQSLLGGEPIDD